VTEVDTRIVQANALLRELYCSVRTKQGLSNNESFQFVTLSLFRSSPVVMNLGDEDRCLHVALPVAAFLEMHTKSVTMRAPSVGVGTFARLIGSAFAFSQMNPSSDCQLRTHQIWRGHTRIFATFCG